MDLERAIKIVEDEIAEENAAIEQAREDLKGLNKELSNLKFENEKKNRELQHKHNQERGEKWAKEHPKEHSAFLEDIRHRHQEFVIEGFLDGWWNLDEDGNMASPAKVFHISDFDEVKNPKLAHVMAKAGIFTSVGQARKNGWDLPLTTGEWTLTKKKIRIKVEE